MAGYLITNRESSESRDRACSGYAEPTEQREQSGACSNYAESRRRKTEGQSRQRKTIVNRGTLLSDIISGSLPKTDAVDVVSQPVVKTSNLLRKII